ncbi:hypothetical protein [Candidatus Nitrososphaera sp. FF02]|uniref:hypothetical protein n=1 Tax=Candidatus Nitrososphaera sp. FF02 TaxID=3398226 RepID=UPI0039EA3E3E
MAGMASILDNKTLADDHAVVQVLTLMAIALREDDLEGAKHYELLALNILMRAERNQPQSKMEQYSSTVR